MSAHREIETAFAMDIGGRERQEDAVNVFSSSNTNAVCLVIADGMGGHSDGDIASTTLVEIAGQEFEQAGDLLDHRLFIEKIIRSSSEKIIEHNERTARDSRTTAVIAIAEDDTLSFANVGDSRAYLISNGAVKRLTRDDSVPEILLAMGEIAEDEMASHPDQGRLTKSIGGSDQIDEVRFGTIKISSGDCVLLCSDGFWETTSRDALLTLADGKALKDEVDALCAAASRAGGAEGDNVSVCALRVAQK